MPTPPKDPTKDRYFSRVREAREALAKKAVDLYEKYDKAITAALAAGQYEVAIKAMQWAIEHMPKDEDGTTMIDSSIDKKESQPKLGPVGPTIQIGIALGGPKVKELPQATVIDIDPDA